MEFRAAKARESNLRFVQACAMQAIGGSTRRINAGSKGQTMAVPLSMYSVPPTEDLALEDFEMYAIDRQQGLVIHTDVVAGT